MIRIVENHDWVILVVLVIIAMYLALFNGLQRGQSIGEYLRQDYKEIQNLFLCWLGISVGYIAVLSVLFSQYIFKKTASLSYEYNVPIFTYIVSYLNM